MYGNLYYIYLWKYAIIIPQTSQFRLSVFRMKAFCQVNFKGYAVFKELGISEHYVESLSVGKHLYKIFDLY